MPCVSLQDPIHWLSAAAPRPAQGAYAFVMLRHLYLRQALPKWRRNAERPSCLHLITLLRKEINLAPLAPFGLHIGWKSLGLAAALLDHNVQTPVTSLLDWSK